jgi:hypothetical protein
LKSGFLIWLLVLLSISWQWVFLNHERENYWRGLLSPKFSCQRGCPLRALGIFIPFANVTIE